MKVFLYCEQMKLTLQFLGCRFVFDMYLLQGDLPRRSNRETNSILSGVTSVCCTPIGPVQIFEMATATTCGNQGSPKHDVNWSASQYCAPF